MALNFENRTTGASIIATSETITSTVYRTMPTPDQVPGLVLPSDGLIVVAYQATWQESVLTAARAAIFVGTTQTKIASGDVASPSTTAAYTGGGTANRNMPLASHGGGLASAFPLVAYGGDVATGQIVGVHGESGAGVSDEFAGSTQTWPNPIYAAGPCYIFAAAGTYTVSVQFKASSGTVTALNRKLWAWVV